jgi:DNA-binding CsgD family transcriptional regulator
MVLQNMGTSGPVVPVSKETLKPDRQAASVEVGLLLLDRAMKVVAFDRGAAAILKNPDGHGELNRPRAIVTLPKDMIETIRNCKLPALSSLHMCLRIGGNEYVCRAYLLEFQNWLSTQPMIAVQLDKVCASNDEVYDVSAKYQLTNREYEVLRGISMGLSSKVMAERMKISPNTVKAFLRLIMIKMGVTSRAGIVANILQNRSGTEQRGNGFSTAPKGEGSRSDDVQGSDGAAPKKSASSLKDSAHLSHAKL